MTPETHELLIRAVEALEHLVTVGSILVGAGIGTSVVLAAGVFRR